MNRLQKKCLIVSIGIHSLLVLVLIVGPAFLTSRKPAAAQVIEFIPLIVTDNNMSGGGSPKGQLPPTAPDAQQKQLVPPTPPEPKPPEPVAKEIPKPEPRPVAKAEPKTTAKTDPDSVEVKSTKPKIQVSTKVVKRNTGSATAQTDARAKAEADARREAARRVSQSIAGLRDDLSPSTSIEIKGPGTGGLPYANFYSALLAIYERAWVPPDGMDKSDAVVGVKVTIEPDGTVSSARITDPSADERVNRSVQQALNRVQHVPMPAGAKDSRTVEFDFKARPKPLI